MSDSTFQSLPSPVDIAKYQPLSKLDKWLGNIGLFGFFKRRYKLEVDDNPFKCWFLLKSMRPQYINIKIASQSDAIIREAMSVRVRYFNWRGHEISGAHRFTRGRRGSRKRLSFFFADPIDAVKRQRLWLRPPKDARFVMLTFERGLYEDWLGFSSKIRLKSLKASKKPSDRVQEFEKLLTSRDRMRMTWFLRHLKADARLYNRDLGNGGRDPIEMARIMLGQMVYLWHGVEEKRTQLIIDDALHLARFGFDLGRPSLMLDHPFSQERDRAHIFDYEKPLIDTWRGSGILSKQMRLEAMVLLQHIQSEEVGTLVVRYGANYLPRIFIALAVQRLSGVDTVIDVRAALPARLRLGEWLYWSSFEGWLQADETEVTFPFSVRFQVGSAAQRQILVRSGIDPKSIIEGEAL